MNTPNKLTVLRLIFVPFYVFFLLMPSIPHHYIIAIILFGAAAYTDHLDGKIARKNNMITDFGKFADPLADKIMILAALACFVQTGLTNAIILILIISREFMVTSIRLVASSQGKVVAANNWGKAKTISQIAAVLSVMLMQYVLELNSLNVISLDNAAQFSQCFDIIGDVFMWIATALTLISGIIYIVQNFEFIKNAK
ncbi:MAG: CDP-diacylglycerol--glycerol-3-phosphate 3-phosphatidyltransferase [Clostridia bacterium]|nr:CDP-diacylglycerol--glycerol-3-phosphate 3-phosphatidyltransferase [Clostridia bacterium]